MAASECVILQQVLAKTCRLEAISLTIGRQPGPQADGYTTNGSFTLRITLK